MIKVGNLYVKEIGSLQINHNLAATGYGSVSYGYSIIVNGMDCGLGFDFKQDAEDYAAKLLQENNYE